MPLVLMLRVQPSRSIRPLFRQQSALVPPLRRPYHVRRKPLLRGSRQFSSPDQHAVIQPHSGAVHRLSLHCRGRGRQVRVALLGIVALVVLTLVDKYNL